MTIERLEELTQEYIQKMKSRVSSKYPDEIRTMLYQEHEQMIREFIGMIPNSNYLEKYRKDFEFDPMTSMTQESMEYTIQSICERINIIKRGLEEDKKIEELEPEKTKQESENYARKSQIYQVLDEMFATVIQKMRGTEFNIDWNAVARNCKEIIENHIDRIAENGFTKKEKDTIEQEVQKYIRRY